MSQTDFLVTMGLLTGGFFLLGTGLAIHALIKEHNDMRDELDALKKSRRFK